MGVFQQAVSIAVFLGVLVLIHEAGHFAAARLMGVRVLKFSIGFGPKLFSFRRGETEFQIAIVPLGGFVAMAGMLPGDDMGAGDEEGEPLSEAEKLRTFSGAPWWKRVFILLAGPGANLVFPVFALFFLYLGDSQEYAARIGAVSPDSPAAAAGFKPGDLVVRIDEVPIRTFAELAKIAQASAGQALRFVVERDGAQVTLDVTPAVVETAGLLEVEKQGRIGISLQEEAAVLGVPEGSAAANAGLRTFDRVVSLNGEGIRSAQQLAAKLDGASGTVKVQVLRFTELFDGITNPQLIDAEVELSEGAGMARIGAENGDAYVWQVRPGTAAEGLGIKRGDRFTKVEGRAVHSASGVEDRMDLARKREVNFEWVSNGEVKTASVGPLMPQGNEKYCMVSPDFGVRFGAPLVPMKAVPGEAVTIHLGPKDALMASLKKLPEGIMVIAKILGKLTTGDVPLEAMGGPLQIAQVATRSAEAGLASFVGSMWVVSVNLALVNLLPIPILDGYGILTALWEAIRRRPVPMRAREIATYIGLGVLGVLMVIAFRNDIARLLFC